MHYFFRFICFIFAILLCFSISSLRLVSDSRDVAKEDGLPTQTDAQSPKITRFLVLGVDRQAKLTDSIFVVTLNETEKNARILQIPRDTYANYTEKDYRKLNGALNALGEARIKAVFSEVLGVPIHYFVILDLSCLRSIVDAIGGVEVNVPQDMVYSDPAQGLQIRLSQGLHRLDGRHAEQFIRYRSGYVNADLGRLDAQKIFLQAFAKTCCTLTAAQLLKVTGLALTRLQTDIGVVDAIRIVSLLRECDTEAIPMATVAGQAAQGKSGAWYYVLNREGACRMINDYLLPDPLLLQTEFDRRGFFDRPDYQYFHEIYVTSEDKLPLD